MTRLLAVSLFVVYAVNHQWAFRAQRVARGVLLLARNSSSARFVMWSELLPSRYVISRGAGWVLWLATMYFAIRGWGGYGAIPLVLYNAIFGSLVDAVSPWPSYRTLLNEVDRRASHIIGVGDGEASLAVVATVRRVEKRLDAGLSFEKAAFGERTQLSEMATASGETGGR